jgi:phosphoglycerate dehydrogenase-like enzyme
LVTKEVVDAAKRVRFIQRYGVGMDHMDVRYVLGKGILLANTPGPASSVALAEHAVLLMLSLAKQVPDWENVIESEQTSIPFGNELRGKSLGLVGLGASGSDLAKLGNAFGMTVRAVDIRTIEPAKVKELGVDFFGTLDSLDYILKESDYISIHVPLTSKTKGMIGRREFGLMKDKARLINVARGPIVDEDALMDSLSSGRIAGAGLDVFPQEPIAHDHPILKMKNVVFSPHIAGATLESIARRADMVGENIKRYLSERPLLYRITDVD